MVNNRYYNSDSNDIDNNSGNNKYSNTNYIIIILIIHLFYSTDSCMKHINAINIKIIHTHPVFKTLY